jgi:hypothetical protein
MHWTPKRLLLIGLLNFGPAYIVSLLAVRPYSCLGVGYQDWAKINIHLYVMPLPLA